MKLFTIEMSERALNLFVKGLSSIKVSDERFTPDEIKALHDTLIVIQDCVESGDDQSYMRKVEYGD